MQAALGVELKSQSLTQNIQQGTKTVHFTHKTWKLTLERGKVYSQHGK